MIRIVFSWLFVSFASVALFPNALAREAHWIEGEDYQTSTFNQHSWYQNSNLQKDLLSPGTAGSSDGQWHAHYTNSGNETATAAYSFVIEEAGSYACWIRLNPFRNSNGGGHYSFSLDGQPFQDLEMSRFDDSLDLVDPGIDIRLIAWGLLGEFDLTSGEHALRIRLTRRPGDSDNHGGVDVLALVNFPWAPSGVLPPDPAPIERRPDEWFPLQAGPDPFSEESIIDMRKFIESPAGSRGPLRRAGKDFQFADGKPVKFWGVNASLKTTESERVEQALFLTKHGVNMVRLHPVQGRLGVLRKNQATGERFLDPGRLDPLDRWFAALKKHGIYSTWSMFYPHVITEDDGYPAELYNELPSASGGKSASGVVAFMEPLQAAEWTWARTLLEHVNPYTGLAYKDDPALAIVEVHNEDSVFWHSPLNDLADGSMPEHRAVLQEKWRVWLKDRYSTDARLKEAWGEGMKAGDALDNPSMKIYAAWEMEEDGPFTRKEAERKRMGDFIRFLAETQRDYFQRRKQQLIDLGFGGVVVTTAWKAGGPAAAAANLWTDDAGDAIDRHSYYGGVADGDPHNIHEGPVHNDSHLEEPGGGILSEGFEQIEDKPFIITEWTQKPPNQWKAEIAPLFAFYGMGLQGWDASFHFASSLTSMGNGWPGRRSYVTATPHYIGQFPALAFAINHGHFKEGDLAAARRLKTDDIFQGIDALTRELQGGGFDAGADIDSLETPGHVLAIGRVTLKFEDKAEPSFASNWDSHWNREAKTISSATGQLTWDYGDRLVRVHSAKTQGLIGFAGGGEYDLPGVRVSVATPFVSLLFTPLDNRDLNKSEHILITALARDKQTGTVYNSDGTRLIEAGGPPLLLEPVQAEIALKGPAIQSVKPVDAYGVPMDRQIEVDQNRFQIDGRYAAYYYEVKRTIRDIPLEIERNEEAIHLLWPDQTGRLSLMEAENVDGTWKDSTLSIDLGAMNRVALQASERQRYYRLELSE